MTAAAVVRRFGAGFGPMGTALRIPAFRLLWLSLLPGTLGMMMAVVAFGYLAYELSGSTTTLALVNAGWGLPMFFLSPVAGVTADRFPRRNVLLFTQGVVGLTAVATAALILTGTIQVWHLLLVTVTQGAAFTFNIPARQALIAELVGPDDLANALALYNAGINFNRVAGPAAGGALLTVPALGAGGVFVIMAGLYLLVLVMLYRLPATPVRSPTNAGDGERAAADAAPRSGPRSGRVTSRVRSLAQFAVGLRYVADRPVLRRLMLLAFLPLLVGMPYQALLPAIAAQTFNTGAAGLGALSAANGLGALAGSLVLAATMGTGAHLTRVQFGTGLVFGISLFAFALCGVFVPALALIAVAGAASSAYTSINNTLLMGHTPPEYHGRVMGVYLMSFSAMPLSSLPAAWFADQFGLQTTLAACGILAGLAVALIGRPGPAAAYSGTPGDASRSV